MISMKYVTLANLKAQGAPIQPRFGFLGYKPGEMAEEERGNRAVFCYLCFLNLPKSSRVP